MATSPHFDEEIKRRLQPLPISMRRRIRRMPWQSTTSCIQDPSASRCCMSRNPTSRPLPLPTDSKIIELPRRPHRVPLDSVADLERLAIAAR